MQNTPEPGDLGETPAEPPVETPTETPTDIPLPEDFENLEKGGPIVGNIEVVYTYDGNGNLVKVQSVQSGQSGENIIYYPNRHYENSMLGTGQTIRKYYFVGESRVAVRVNGTITWLLSDHLGSTTGTVNASGALTSSPKYTAFLLRCARSASQARQEGRQPPLPTTVTPVSAKRQPSACIFTRPGSTMLRWAGSSSRIQLSQIQQASNLGIDMRTFTIIQYAIQTQVVI